MPQDNIDPRENIEDASIIALLKELGKRLVEIGGSVAKPISIIVLATLLVLGGVSFYAQPALAISITADDVSITTADGQISAVNITPTITVAWDVADAPSNITLLLQTTDGSGGVVTMRERKKSVSGTEGNVTFTFSEINILNASSQYSASDFTASDGSTKNTTVYLRIYAATEGGSFVQTSQKPTFVVSVTNEADTISVSGVMNTGVAG